MAVWTRIKNDTPLLSSPSTDSDIVGRMKHTYGVKILDVSGEYFYVFSPDWNRNGYVMIKDVRDVDYFLE